MNRLNDLLPLNLASLYRTLKRNQQKEDKKYREWLRVQICAKCDRKPCVVAHQRILGGGGMGLKPPDYDALPLCHECHSKEHRGAITFWQQPDKESTREYVSNICDQHMMRYIDEKGIKIENYKEDAALDSRDTDDVSMQEVEQWVA